MRVSDEVKPAPESGRGPRFVLTALPFRLLLATLIWMLLTAGDLGSLAVGAAVIAAAALASAILTPRLPWRPHAIFGFAAYFLVQSLRGAVDVARRAFHPALPLTPGVVEHRFRIAGELPRVALVNTISLLPGTLGADIDATSLYVHTLDLERGDLRRSIETAEARIAALFGLSLSAPGGRG